MLSRYPRNLSALQEVLKIAQKQFGEINEKVELLVAETLDVSPIKVYEVVNFYGNLWEGPYPEKRFKVCTGLSCQLRGADEVVDTLCDHYDVMEGELDPDKDILIREMECIAACDGAPAVIFNDSVIPDLDPESARELAEEADADASGIPSPDDQKPQKRPDASKQVLTARMDHDDSHTLERYRKEGGYEAAEKALTEMTPEEVTETVKEAGVQGRGGAGFPAGVKWSFIPDPDELDRPIYLTVNADESEPGTFKDRLILEEDPHQLLEGIILCCYAVGAHTSYIYIRGKFGKGYRRIRSAINDAYEAGLLGEDLFDTGFDLDVYPHRGGGAYICGEETAMLESLEGKKALPRIRPPFPAQKGLYDCPTVVNNVETLSNVPHIIEHGAEWYKNLGGDPENPGTRLFCVSGDVARPGIYEAPLDIPAEELLYDLAGGVRNDNDLKAFIPGGASAPVLTPDEMDVRMDYGSLQDVGSIAGSGGVMVIDDTRCMLRVLQNFEHFFHVESCGQCTPCREGTGWAEKVITRVENGNGRDNDMKLLKNMKERIQGKTICALADGAVGPLESIVNKYEDEIQRHIDEQECPFRNENTEERSS